MTGRFSEAIESYIRYMTEQAGKKKSREQGVPGVIFRSVRAGKGRVKAAAVKLK